MTTDCCRDPPSWTPSRARRSAARRRRRACSLAPGSHRVGHPRLPRPGRPPAGHADAYGDSSAGGRPARYWARSHVGWRGSPAAPNAGHRAVARCSRGLLRRGHHPERRRAAPGRRAPRRDRAARQPRRVVCLACGDVRRRAGVRAPAARSNPGFDGAVSRRDQPRRRRRAARRRVAGFDLPGCLVCGGAAQARRGVLRRVGAARGWSAASTLVERRGALLVLGSSLAVMSGYRFVRRAAKQDPGRDRHPGRPVATRGRRYG